MRSRLTYDRGTLVWHGPLPERCRHLMTYDPRIERHRAPADSYRALFALLHLELGDQFEDQSRGYQPLELTLRSSRRPFAHQQEALDAWLEAGKRGLVVLPTGSGKTFVAELAIQKVGRSTLVVVPTIDLLNQWYSSFLVAFDISRVGLVGGGYYEIDNLTVTTYDSFQIHAERLGPRFALLVFDECHHLPSPSYAQAASCYIAPFRLGLSATPERNDQAADPYEALIGSIVYRRHIKEMAGQHLAEYQVERVSLPLSDEERLDYDEARATYVGFLRRQDVRMNSSNGWQTFIMLAARSREGREALLAYRRQRQIAMTCRAKMDYLELLLTRHAKDRLLVFTNDNYSAYRIARWFLIPVITHQTPIKERKAILDGIRDGTYRAVVTSKVLNEGIDIPAANVAVILSGTSSVREHVQRLGRILRHQSGKQALLYELLSKDTMELNVSERRSDHDAYR